MYKLILDGTDEIEAVDRAQEEGKIWHNGTIAPWAQWRLIIDGDEYFGKFKSEIEWAEHYG